MRLYYVLGLLVTPSRSAMWLRVWLMIWAFVTR
jgi:hypothetical protein